mmetsp:Transcript_65348/g.200048  ORF Transcript_65348/g.200048 Transcript_65348/m.200048 type:complete len:287 (-) Transcript_65348:1193-2053(-)
MRDDCFEHAGPQIQTRAHQHSARGPANDRDIAVRGPTRLREVLGCGIEVIKRALLCQKLRGLVPRLTKIATAANVRGRDHETEVCVQRIEIAPSRLFTNTVRTVAVQEQRHASVFFQQRFFVEDGDRNGRRGRGGGCFPSALRLQLFLHRWVQCCDLILGVRHINTLRAVQLLLVIRHLLLLYYGQIARRRAKLGVRVPDRRTDRRVNRDGDQVFLVITNVRKSRIVRCVVWIDTRKVNLLPLREDFRRAQARIVRINEKPRLAGLRGQIADAEKRLCHRGARRDR